MSKTAFSLLYSGRSAFRLNMLYSNQHFPIGVTISGMTISELLSIIHKIEVSATVDPAAALIATASGTIVTTSEVLSMLSQVAVATDYGITLNSEIVEQIYACLMTSSSFEFASSVKEGRITFADCGSDLTFTSEIVNQLLLQTSNLDNIIELTESIECTNIILFAKSIKHNLHIGAVVSIADLIAADGSNFFSISTEANASLIVYRPLSEIASEQLSVYSSKTMNDWFYKYV